jgi:hypothetical protein
MATDKSTRPLAKAGRPRPSLEDMRAYLAAGHSRYAAAAHFGISVSWFNTLLRCQKPPSQIRRGGTNANPVTSQMVADFMRAGHSRAEAAAHFGVSYSLIIDRLLTGGLSNQFPADRRQPYSRRRHGDAKGICSCCKAAPIAPGNRFLCAVCYRQNSEAADYGARV